MNALHWKTLVAAPVLHEHLHDAQVVLIDCRSELGDADAGARAYAAGHLPGASYAHLNHDLSGSTTPLSGRHPLPDIKTLSAKLSRWGIDATKQVVVYDADNGAMAASRLWWLLRWLGHVNVAVLDGGLNHWQACGFEVSTSHFTPPATQFIGHAHAEMLVDADATALHATQSDWRVLDARAAERYAGVVEPLDPCAGHVPGAVNHPFTRNVAADGRFLPAATLRKQFNDSTHQVASHHIIAMCGSGVTACQNLLALEIAGLHGARLYAGSWSEWSRQGRPVEVGAQP